MVLGGYQTSVYSHFGPLWRAAPSSPEGSRTSDAALFPFAILARARGSLPLTAAA